jgi:hypothetical protein
MNHGIIDYPVFTQPKKSLSPSVLINNVYRPLGLFCALVRLILLPLGVTSSPLGPTRT